ncbi:hypothetical protein KY358_04895 [Candidatus Woesearchaeota archaeon]|nr:hypothetical protein [Candidatus Woesearchaeota archaeon]
MFPFKFIIFVLVFIFLFIIFSRICYSFIKGILIYHNYLSIYPEEDKKELQKKRVLKVTNTYYVISIILTFVIYSFFQTNIGDTITQGLSDGAILAICFLVCNCFLMCIRVTLLCKKTNLKILCNTLPKKTLKKIEGKLDKTAKKYIEYVTNFLFSICLGAAWSVGMYASFIILFEPSELKKLFPPTNMNINLLLLGFSILFILFFSYLFSYIFAVIGEYVLLKKGVHESCILLEI